MDEPSLQAAARSQKPVESHPLNDWSGKRVLLTGAGGFIGSHLTEALVQRGAEVRAFVRYNSRGDIGLLGELPPAIRAQVEVIAGDLRNPRTVRQSVTGQEIVFHLAAVVSIPYSYRRPVDVVETNIMGTLNLLLACLESEVTRLIHTSSSEVYGTALRVPIDESHPLQGQSPYSASKIGADKLVESFFCSYQLPVVTVRPFNTYGPRQSARAVIPTIITQALTLSTVRLGALQPSRDFTYMSDTVAGFLKAAQAADVEGQTFNLGNGQDISIGDLAREIIRLIDRPVDIIVDPVRMRPEKSEVQCLRSDYSRAREHLAWTPLVSLKQGLRLTINWIQEHLDRYRVGVYEF